jgi:hypothetical protein
MKMPVVFPAKNFLDARLGNGHVASYTGDLVVGRERATAPVLG